MLDPALYAAVALLAAIFWPRHEPASQMTREAHPTLDHCDVIYLRRVK